jgi:enoyl-CoA hydratase/carnithine racemase
VRAAVVGADEALRAGLAEHVAAPPDTALGLARTLGAQIVALPPRAVAAAKRVVGGVAPAALTAEAEVFAELWGGVDHRLAVDRFLARPRG